MMNDFQICSKEMCTGCGACSQVCPKGCISMEPDEEGFLYPRIDKDACVDCHLCEKKCPSLHKTEGAGDSAYYMAIHKDKEILQKSSSGGAFSAIASYVLEAGGVIFGACMDPGTKEVYHIQIEAEGEMDQLRLSKYYQSNTKETYLAAKALLKEGRKVLFTGTACQIAGLYAVCGRPENLLTVDILCHGASSKLFADAYIKSQEKRFKKTVAHYQFRVKEGEEGWKSGGGTRMLLKFTDGTSFVADKETDTFFLAFNANLILRESCYQCPYAGPQRIGDFTLADFWGVTAARATPEEMKNGISLMLVNSPKGAAVLEQLGDKLQVTPIQPEEATPYNSSLIRPNRRPEKRDKVVKALIRGKDFNRTVRGAMRVKLLKRRIRRMIGPGAVRFVKRIRGKKV